MQLTLVADTVKDYNDVATNMRHCVNLCNVLGNQAKIMKNSVRLYSLGYRTLGHPPLGDAHAPPPSLGYHTFTLEPRAIICVCG